MFFDQYAIDLNVFLDQRMTGCRTYRIMVFCPTVALYVSAVHRMLGPKETRKYIFYGGFKLQGCNLASHTHILYWLLFCGLYIKFCLQEILIRHTSFVCKSIIHFFVLSFVTLSFIRINESMTNYMLYPRYLILYIIRKKRRFTVSIACTIFV